eukprot:gene2985-3442_t
MDMSLSEHTELNNDSRLSPDVDKDTAGGLLLAANKAATNFLGSIDLKTLSKTSFTDVLGTVSNTGKEIGELVMTVEETVRGGEICYLVHAHSHGIIDNIPCGTSVTAYVARGLVTLEQTQHEYMKLPHNPLDKKINLQKQGGQYVLKMITCQGESQEVVEKTYNTQDMKGFISEAAQMSQLESRRQLIGDQTFDVVGIGKSILTSHGETSWKSFFLNTGGLKQLMRVLIFLLFVFLGRHMACRSRLDSPVSMQLFKVPTLEEDERDELPVDARRKEHRWEEDMQFWSRFLDRKEELKSDHSTYVRRHPELKALMTDFLQFLLLRKPDNVCTFASNYFETFSSMLKWIFNREGAVTVTYFNM